MQVSPVIALIFSLLSAWLVSSAVDWRYVPWGAQNAEIYFGIAALGLLASTALICISLRRIGLNRTGTLLAVVTMALLAFAIGEWVVWGLFEGEYPTLVRQRYGLVTAPIAMAAAALVLWLRATAGQPSTLLRSALLGALIIMVGVVAVGVLLQLRRPEVSQSYDFLQTVIFAVLVTSAASAGGAVAGHSLHILAARD